MTRIPIAIVTGFLGSGKTTLLNRLLREPALAHTAVVMNEFGEIGLDHALVAASKDHVVLLENGCLCCAVRGDLVATLDDLHNRRSRGDIPRFDRIVIETSGLADPSPVIHALLAEPTLAARFSVGTIVATVDAVNARHTLDSHMESVRQAALADRILITKFDLVQGDESEALGSLVARLRGLNPAAQISRCDDPSLIPADLLHCPEHGVADDGANVRRWLNAEAFEYHHHEDSAHDCDHHGHFERQIESFCIVREEPFTEASLRLLIDALTQNMGPNLLRVKALLNIAEEPARPAVLQGAQRLLHELTWLDRWPDDDRRSKLVFITQGIGQDEIEDTIALLDRVAARTATARQKVRDDQVP